MFSAHLHTQHARPHSFFSHLGEMPSEARRPESKIGTVNAQQQPMNG